MPLAVKQKTTQDTGILLYARKVELLNPRAFVYAKFCTRVGLASLVQNWTEMLSDARLQATLYSMLRSRCMGNGWVKSAITTAAAPSPARERGAMLETSSPDLLEMAECS